MVFTARRCVSEVFAVVRSPSVCLSVCHVGVLVYFIYTAEDIANFFLDPVAPSLCFLTPSPVPNSKGAPSMGAHNTSGGGKILRFSTEITVYLGNGTREARVYYGTFIGSHRWRIDTCRFRWPWVIPNPDFQGILTYKSNISKTMHPWDKVSIVTNSNALIL